MADTVNAPSGRGHNRLAALAAEVRALQAGIRRQSEQVARDVIEAGRQLMEAKELLAHGEWLPWLREHAGISPRTASRYMQVARSQLDIGQLADLALGVSEQSTARAEAIRGHVADAREYLVELGRELTEIRDEIGDSERFAHFVADEFGWHGPEADQFMALAGAADAGTPPPAGEITLYALRAAAAAVEKVE
jgi:Protein of unknown function (DUF3102)